MPQGHACPGELQQPRKTENTGVLAGIAACGRSRKWAYGGGSRLGFEQKGGLPCGNRDNVERKQYRTLVGKRGVKELSLAGQEVVPCGFGLRTGGGTAQPNVLGTVGDLPNRAQITGKNWEE